MQAYLDNAATTKPCEQAVSAVVDALVENYGNPSSLHRIGLKAEEAVTDARKAIATALSTQPECVTFTSGATESNNLAIIGSAKTYGKRKKKIVSTTVEHPSVARTLDYLEENGFEVIRVAPNHNGEILPDDIISAVDDNTCLVTCMLINNETGYILPIKKAFTAIKRLYPECITHSDCAQAFLKTPIKFADLSADMISISGHKIHAPKGVGAIIKKKEVRLLPVMFGGGQEKGLRSGTESVPLISAFGASAKEFYPTLSNAISNAKEMNAYLRKELSRLPDISINSSEDLCSPFILNFSAVGIRSEIMLHFLESKGIFVSSGSACSKGAKSSVLGEFRITDECVDSALRISFSRFTTWQDIDMLINGLIDGRQSISR
ncbi:MAG: cysteine desulfurase family protein [Oscillospiraceae bacterium]